VRRVCSDCLRKWISDLLTSLFAKKATVFTVAFFIADPVFVLYR